MNWRPGSTACKILKLTRPLELVWTKVDDHFLMTFKFTLMDYTTVGNKFYYSRSLSESTVQVHSFSIIMLFNGIVSSFTSPLHNTLDPVAPLKKRASDQKCLTPWSMAMSSQIYIAFSLN